MPAKTHESRGQTPDGKIFCECGRTFHGDGDLYAAELEWREHREQETGVPFYEKEPAEKEAPGGE